MPTVRHPPALVAQETPAWCFAAAEQMIRRYYGHPDPGQYAIARAALAARAAAGDPAGDLAERWAIAVALDASAGRAEMNGNNPDSEIAKIVCGEWGVVAHEMLGGRYHAGPLTRTLVEAEIKADRIFLVADAIHFYVVYGLDGDEVLVRDPWPAGRGGQTARLRIADVAAWPHGSTILFS